MMIKKNTKGENKEGEATASQAKLISMDAAQATVLLQLRFMVGASFHLAAAGWESHCRGPTRPPCVRAKLGCTERLGASELAAVTAVHRGHDGQCMTSI